MSAKSLQIPTEAMRDRFRQALGQHVGRGRKFSREDFGEACGFDPRTTEKYCLGEQLPCAAKLFTIMRVIGEPQFVNALLDLAGFDGATRLNPANDSTREGLQLCGSASRLIGDLIEHRSDGRLTPREELSEAHRAAALGNEALQYSRDIRKRYQAA